jgi:hypothetical protein
MINDDLAAHAGAIINADLHLTLGHDRPRQPPVDIAGLLLPPRATATSTGSLPLTPGTPATLPSAHR